MIFPKEKKNLHLAINIFAACISVLFFFSLWTWAKQFEAREIYVSSQFHRACSVIWGQAQQSNQEVENQNAGAGNFLSIQSPTASEVVAITFRPCNIPTQKGHKDVIPRPVLYSSLLGFSIQASRQSNINDHSFHLQIQDLIILVALFWMVVYVLKHQFWASCKVTSRRL